MISGLTREREMSVIVTTLTNVVTGDVPSPPYDPYNACVTLSNGGNCSSSLSVGAKRGRVDDNGDEDFTKLYKKPFLDEFPHGNLSLLLFLFSFLPCIFFPTEYFFSKIGYFDNTDDIYSHI